MSDCQRYRLVLAYDGTDFHGWQRQEPPDAPALRTVQGVVGDTLQRVLRQPIKLVGASRTDAGVHAQGQVAHFDVGATAIPFERWRRAVNDRLPDDIDIRDIAPVRADFDAIADALTKQYRYHLFVGQRKPLMHRRTAYPCRYLLDIDRMNDAARRLVGTHDVHGLAAASHGRENTVRTLHHCDVSQVEDLVTLTVEGSGFLYHMVRIIAGTLLEVGRGHFPPSRIDEILASRDRQLAGPTLEPQGLCLQWIKHR